MLNETGLRSRYFGPIAVPLETLSV